MDRSSLCSKLKHSNFSKVGRNPSWDIPFGKDNCYSNMINNGGDYNHSLVAAGGLFSWPPTCYTCSFCKREFRSAQALGGHMNVHRRDKARLMRPQSPPKNDDNDDVVDHNPNLEFPNPSSAFENPNVSPSFTEFPHLASALPRFFARTQMKNKDGARPVITRDFMKIKDPKGLPGVREFDLFVSEEVVKKRGFAQLDLEIGLVNSHQSKEELDLELRL